MINLSISLILAYLIGSIPTSFIFGKILKNIDIRKHGSGNVGATNVFRVAGKIPALIVLLLDIFKGSFAVLFLPEVFFNNAIGITIGFEVYQILLGLFVISGHVWSVFLKFKGGKGVATTAGVILVLAPKILIGSLFIWILVFLAFRIVSVASITASIFLPIFAIIFHRPIYMVLFCVLLCIFGTYKHKSNIKRLIRGEEKKLF
ncbi:MAG: glycerol-3-phosphate 1-O-acyltransferase PlsY [Candidatus Omnitrophota bacterium]|nr:MAG: glycerol-3-phosphate 1-O-acyltransferase PlsY [Candidatus Omnitrophota bacterium]